MTEKMLGYVLLTIGLLVIVYSAVSVVSIVLGKGKPIQFISQSENLNINFSAPTGLQGSDVGVPVKFGENQSFTKIINLSIHLFLMGFLSSVGYKISLIGAQLVRPIIIKAKEEVLNK